MALAAIDCSEALDTFWQPFKLILRRFLKCFSNGSTWASITLETNSRFRSSTAPARILLASTPSTSLSMLSFLQSLRSRVLQVDGCETASRNVLDTRANLAFSFESSKCSKTLITSSLVFVFCL